MATITTPAADASKTVPFTAFVTTASDECTTSWLQT